MRKLALSLAVASAVVLLLGAVASADAVHGSLSFVFVNATQNGTDLSTSTFLVATNSLTEAGGTGDFAGVPALTSFGPMTLNEATITTGGGFFVSNLVWGNFTADGASVITRTPTFLNIDMLGTFTPGPGLGDDFTPTPAVAHVTFDETGPALSGAFTLETPEAAPTPEGPSGILLLTGGALVAGAYRLRSGPALR